MPAAEPTPAVLWEDLRPVLDEEVGRLPDKYRVPVVLCYLGGKTYDEAAAGDRLPEGDGRHPAGEGPRPAPRPAVRPGGHPVRPPASPRVLADNARAAVPAVLLHRDRGGGHVVRRPRPRSPHSPRRS